MFPQRLSQLLTLLLGLVLQFPALGQVENSSEPIILDEATDYYVDYRGLNIRYQQHGNGDKSVVMIHGGACNLSFWALQVDALAADYRLLLIDLPGHGKSDQPTDFRYSMMNHAGAVVAVMDDASVESAVLVGHSMGVPVMRQFSRAYPSRIDGLVAVDGLLMPPPSSFFMNMMIWAMDTWLYDYIWPPMVEGFTGDLTPSWGVEKVNKSMKHASKALVRSFYPEMLHEEVMAPLKLEVPILAILAENPMWNDDYIAQLKALNNQTEVEMMSGTSHFLMLDKPAEFNKLLSDFLSRTYTRQ